MSAAPRRSQRLASLDALRGLDMFGICGGHAIVAGLAAWTGWGVLARVEAQMHHVEWDGFTAWDLVFPLFLFLAGVSFTLSLAARRARGQSDAGVRRHAVRRALVLVALGVLVNVGRDLDVSNVRYASVLGRIGLAWMLGVFVALRWGARGQWLAVAAILLGYWALMTLVPVPGQGEASLEPGRTLADWLDRQLLPGRLHRTVRDPEGLLATLPAVATALLGMRAGSLLSPGPGAGGRGLVLILTGLVGLALGALWNEVFPINKNLWSSSFVLWTAGWSSILLGAAHAVVDGLELGRASLPLRVLGANSIAAYVGWRFVPFREAAELALGAPASAGERVAVACLAFGLLWLVLAFLHRRRWFLRV